ncbi:hypothetical protein [Olleya sp. YS]|uniref:hypothetical protein n=1 Tax=Olleya sp. YS TaxID=3028318 RepID=UPI0024342EDE|nr:hypothetical protein [Olleya sp. YS]WGD35552.1 hypothetical protein Ollyesu_03890 [Olleya sp. YS]
MSSLTPLTRTIEEAKTWTENWQKNNPDLPKAFLIPADDLIACFNTMDIDVTVDANGKLHLKVDRFEPGVRSYIGIDDNDEAHLLIVGTSTSDGKNYEDHPENGVFDFTRPCPSNCDPKSIMFHKEVHKFSK